MTHLLWSVFLVVISTIITVDLAQGAKYDNNVCPVCLPPKNPSIKYQQGEKCTKCCNDKKHPYGGFCDYKSSSHPCSCRNGPEKHPNNDYDVCPMCPSPKSGATNQGSECNGCCNKNNYTFGGTCSYQSSNREDKGLCACKKGAQKFPNYDYDVCPECLPPKDPATRQKEDGKCDTCCNNNNHPHGGHCDYQSTNKEHNGLCACKKGGQAKKCTDTNCKQKCTEKGYDKGKCNKQDHCSCSEPRHGQAGDTYEENKKSNLLKENGDSEHN